MFEKCKGTVQKIIQLQNSIALKTDIWSSQGHDSVLSFTAHFITEEGFSRKHCLLQAGKFNQRHTADNIFSIVSHWSIMCVLRDGGSNFVAGLNCAGVTNVTCLAHNLQRVIHDGVLALKDIQDLLAARRRIVGHYKHSNVAFHALQKIQAQLELKVCALYQDEPTWWNSA